jgi:3-oxoacyl-[acyl-carrier-protein] synthase-3
MLPFEKMDNPRMAYFRMNGNAVFEFASKQGTQIVIELLEQSGAALNDVDWFIVHQANINIIDTIASGLGVSKEKFVINLDRYGNTASASVLVALDEAISSNTIRRGELVVTSAFGGGLSWGANLIRI